MTYIDSAILNLTEWLCRKFQLLTGRTNVWLAVQLTNLSIIVYFVWAGVYFWSSDVAARIALGLFCSGVLYVLTPDSLQRADRSIRERRLSARRERLQESETTFGMRACVFRF